jgi:hypothetical protein
MLLQPVYQAKPYYIIPKSFCALIVVFSQGKLVFHQFMSCQNLHQQVNLGHLCYYSTYHLLTSRLLQLSVPYHLLFNNFLQFSRNIFVLNLKGFLLSTNHSHHSFSY